MGFISAPCEERRKPSHGFLLAGFSRSLKIATSPSPSATAIIARLKEVNLGAGAFPSHLLTAGFFSLFFSLHNVHPLPWPRIGSVQNHGIDFNSPSFCFVNPRNPARRSYVGISFTPQGRPFSESKPLPHRVSRSNGWVFPNVVLSFMFPTPNRPPLPSPLPLSLPLPTSRTHSSSTGWSSSVLLQ